MSKDPNHPTLVKQDLKEYEHLTEKERMNAGYPYIPFDEVLTTERLKARKLTKKYNALEVDDDKGRQTILDELLNPICRGKKLFIESPFRVDYGYNLFFGNNLQANFDCVFLDCAPITIGDNCLMAPGVHIYAATHPLNPKYRKDDDEYYELAFPVKIGDNCWIGGKAVICPGVTIGDNVTIGAGAVVTKDVPSNVVVAGNPAKTIRQLNFDESK